MDYKDAQRAEATGSLLSYKRGLASHKKTYSDWLKAARANIVLIQNGKSEALTAGDNEEIIAQLTEIDEAIASIS